MAVADRGGRWTRTDGLLCALGVAALLPRVLLRGRGVFDIDSALLTLGVRSYDFASYHPHPPYHPLSIAAAKALAPLVGPADALVWVSLVAGAVLAVAVFGIGRELGGRAVGAYAALLVALSPLATQEVGVALTYANEPAAVALVAWAALHARASRTGLGWVLLGVASSVAVGMRPSAAIVAAPLVLWATRINVAALAKAAAAGAGATLAWLPAAVVAGGGWSLFTFGNRFQTRLYVLHDPVWQGGWGAVHSNLAWLGHHLHDELPWLLVVGVLATVAALPLASRRSAHRGFLLAWGGPTLLFYGLVYGGWPAFHSGYALGVLPPAFVGGALVILRVHEAVRSRVHEVPLRVGTSAVLVFVVAMPLAWPAQWDEALEPRRAAEDWVASWDGLEEALPPERTALFGAYSAHWALVDHPAYLTWVVETAMASNGSLYLQVAEWEGGHVDRAYFDNIRDGPVDARHPIPPGIEEIALVAGHPIEGAGPFPFAAMPVKRVVQLPGGAFVTVFDARPLQTIEDGVAGYGQWWPHPSDRVWPPSG